MSRRGLNFITDKHEENLDEQSVLTIEKEIDNVCPKIVGILALNDCCDTKIIRDQLVEYCVQYMDTLNLAKNKNNMDEEIKID
jgi:hypothetical protein